MDINSCSLPFRPTKLKNSELVEKFHWFENYAFDLTPEFYESDMNDILKIDHLKDMIIEIKRHSVLLDSDVANIYGVETKHGKIRVVDPVGFVREQNGVNDEN